MFPNFTALDTEFTGLKINAQSKSSLFDDAEERYKKIRQTVTQITISQLGKYEFSIRRSTWVIFPYRRSLLKRVNIKCSTCTSIVMFAFLQNEPLRKMGLFLEERTFPLREDIYTQGR